MMKQYQDVFKRYEKKYMLDEWQYAALQKWLPLAMEQDQYGLHTICSIYYDTDSYELIRASLEKPVYKEKLRLRSYGVPKQESTVFLELKKKCEGVVYKRRVPLHLKEANQYLLSGQAPQQECQILKEIDWFLSRRSLSPKAFLASDRIALFGKSDPELRITFDQNIRWREFMLDLSKGDFGHPLLEAGKVLMEVKIPGAMPLWLSRILNDLKIYPVSFSKYGTCYKEFLLPLVAEQKGGVICA